ncbi:MAG TPA: HAD family phosphatase, partial [Candidatus Andersenbacteria bacterium]|nr:HAD family phosphatase [Candidatus Andersenbacteria bacterium]
MSVVGVAFDLEGTVVDFEECHRRNWRVLGARYGLENFDVVPRFLGVGDRLVAQELAERTQQSVDVLLAEKKALFWEAVRRQGAIAPRESWTTVFRQLQAAGIPMAIGSLTRRESALILLDQSGLSEKFSLEQCVFAEDVAHIKPAPDVFLETARRLGIDSHEQLVFEDSVVGVQAAVAAGSA